MVACPTFLLSEATIKLAIKCLNGDSHISLFWQAGNKSAIHRFIARPDLSEVNYYKAGGMINFYIKTVQQFRSKNAGATAIEYALIAAIISISLITSAVVVGKDASAKIQCTGVLVKKAEKIKNPDRRFKRCVKNKRKK